MVAKISDFGKAARLPPAQQYVRTAEYGTVTAMWVVRATAGRLGHVGRMLMRIGRPPECCMSAASLLGLAPVYGPAWMRPEACSGPLLSCMGAQGRTGKLLCPSPTRRAPEVLERHELSKAGDVYAFGVLLWCAPCSVLLARLST